MSKKNSKSLVKQLLDAKSIDNQDLYDDLYLEISEQIESLCCKMQYDCLSNRDAVMILVDILKSKAKDLKQHAADL